LSAGLIQLIAAIIAGRLGELTVVSLLGKINVLVDPPVPTTPAMIPFVTLILGELYNPSLRGAADDKTFVIDLNTKLLAVARTGISFTLPPEAGYDILPTSRLVTFVAVVERYSDDCTPSPSNTG
jgi:hypothetical protein